jgi:hypothetical protein
MMNVAMMLSEWVDISAGHAFRSSLADEPPGNIGVLTMAQSVGDSVTESDELPQIAFAGNTIRLRLEHGDVIFRPRGVSIQSIFIESVRQPCIFAAPLVRIRVLDPQKLEPRYLHWVLNSPAIQRDIHAQARGSMIRMVSLQSLRAIAIPVPSIDVQRKIAGVAMLQRQERALSEALLEKTQLHAGHILWAAAQQ